MLQQFSRHVKSKSLLSKSDRLLLGISGGIDSVVLCHLLVKMGCSVTLAHCNYKLRGKDSDADEAFCKKLALQLKVPIRVRTVNVTGNKGSLQENARKARYTWFRDLLSEHGLDYIVTAHHAGDQAETLLINLVRGTGLKGMRGIAEKEGVLVRPLLAFTREDIKNYAKKNKIKYRTDKSNAKTKYRRNFIRHKIMPLLKTLNPSIEITLAGNASRFREEFSILTSHLKSDSENLVTRGKGGVTKIDLDKLRHSASAPALLRFLLEPFGFNSAQVNKISDHLRKNGLPGKKLFSPTHRLTIDRNEIVVEKISREGKSESVLESEEALKEAGLMVQAVDSLKVASKNELIVSPSRLQWPLIVRGIRKGDRFRPFGMKGKKLLSDYLREQKLNAFEKERVRLLENGNGEIIWVIGHRSDERYRVGENDKSIIKITFIE